MPHRMNVVLLYGGKSGEHEVSLRSAASVLHHIDNTKYNLIPVGIDKDGQIFVNEREALLETGDSLPVQGPNAKALPSLIQNGQFAIPAQCVFPVTHGPLYEDGVLQGILRHANIAFVGSDVLASSIGMDKDIARRLVCDDEIHCARYARIDWNMTRGQKQAIVEHFLTHCTFPLFVKPCSLGSSVAIQKVNSKEETIQAVDHALRYDESALIEEFVEGREIELAVLEHPNIHSAPDCSVPGEIRVHHADGFYSYSAKYIESDCTELIIPAPLSRDTITRLQEKAKKIFLRMRCGGLARVDFFVNEESGTILFNEINTLPGFTSISMYPQLWAHCGIPYPQLLERLINVALSHQACRLQLITSFQ
jgi:D-alanine-D-alanine ligase